MSGHTKGMDVTLLDAMGACVFSGIVDQIEVAGGLYRRGPLTDAAPALYEALRALRHEVLACCGAEMLQEKFYAALPSRRQTGRR